MDEYDECMLDIYDECMLMEDFDDPYALDETVEVDLPY